MYKSHVVGLVEGLRFGYPEYTEKLLEDLTIFGDPDDEDPVTKRTRSSKQPAALEKFTKTGEVEGEKPKGKDTLSRRGYAQAVEYNLKDMNQVAKLNEYLAATAHLELFQTPKNGQCFWASIRRGLNCKEEFRNNHLRYQTIEFVALNHGFCFTMLKQIIATEYGNEDAAKDPEEPGPFTFIEYLLYMLESTSWADHGMVLMVSMMWQVPITILNAEELEPLKFRHDRLLKDTELVLVYAGRAHYLGTCEYSLILPVPVFVWGRCYLCGAGAFGAEPLDFCAGPIVRHNRGC